MDKDILRATAAKLVADGRGILAADESTPTCTKRFEAIGIQCTQESRRDYRAALFSTPGLEDSIAGVILFDETLRQTTVDGTPIPKLLASKGIMPGIKVDSGAHPLAGHPGELVTEGLDGLRSRLAEYHELGARFAKWRAVITVGTHGASPGCQIANAHALARYASLCQEAGMVPIVEPEVLMDGAHDQAACRLTTKWAWLTLFEQMAKQNVYLPGILLKPSMVIAGKDAANQADAGAVAEETFQLLMDCVPAGVPGVVFLSGGQTPEEATEHLRRMNTLGDKPWALSFSFGRALQEPALAAWAKSTPEDAQAALKERCNANRAAALGKSWVPA